MEFLKEILGDELYNQFAEKLKGAKISDKEIKLANLSTGEYVGKDKFDKLELDRNDWKTKYGDIETKLKAFDGVDLATMNKQIEDLKTEITTNQQAYEADKAKTQMLYDTDKFLSGYNFVNDYTKKAFMDNLNSALDDTANKGKSRQELFEAMTKDSEGNALSNIFVEAKQDAQADNNEQSNIPKFPNVSTQTKNEDVKNTNSGKEFNFNFQTVRPIPTPKQE